MAASFTVALSNAFAYDDPDMPDSVYAGNLNGTPIIANPGDTITVPVWLKNDEDLVGIYTPIALPTGYISARLEGEFYGIFCPDSTPHWDWCDFTMTYQNLPDTGYNTYQAVMVSEMGNPYVWLTFNSDSVWTRIVDYKLVIDTSTSLIGDTIQIISGCNRFYTYCDAVPAAADYSFELAFHGSQIIIATEGLEYLPGDANMVNGAWPPAVIGSDLTFLVNYFRGLTQSCLIDSFFCSADANGDCQVIGSDVTRLQSYLNGGAFPTYCPDYPTLWPTLNDRPASAPSGWPNCESAK